MRFYIYDLKSKERKKEDGKDTLSTKRMYGWMGDICENDGLAKYSEQMNDRRFAASLNQSINQLRQSDPLSHQPYRGKGREGKSRKGENEICQSIHSPDRPYVSIPRSDTDTKIAMKSVQCCESERALSLPHLCRHPKSDLT